MLSCLSAKVNDSNARKWIANSDLLSRDGNLIGLSVPGRERAQEVLRQVLDPNLETKWILGSKSSTRTSKESSKMRKIRGQEVNHLVGDAQGELQFCSGRKTS